MPGRLFIQVAFLHNYKRSTTLRATDLKVIGSKPKYRAFGLMMWYVYFSNTPYPDVKCGFYTPNDAFKQILKSDSDFKLQKMKNRKKKWKLSLFFTAYDF